MPKVQSAIRPMLVSAAIRLNPHSVMRETQSRFRRSHLELRGPRSGPAIPRALRPMKATARIA
eukprot:11990618-Alexandrium_andersonii.AAC.1